MVGGFLPLYTGGVFQSSADWKPLGGSFDFNLPHAFENYGRGLRLASLKDMFSRFLCSFSQDFLHSVLVSAPLLPPLYHHHHLSTPTHTQPPSHHPLFSLCAIIILLVKGHSLEVLCLTAYPLIQTGLHSFTALSVCDLHMTGFKTFYTTLLLNTGRFKALLTIKKTMRKLNERFCMESEW